MKKYRDIFDILENRYKRFCKRNMPGISIPSEEEYIDWLIRDWENREHKCFYCGDDMDTNAYKFESISINHIIPISQGGDNSKDNLVLCHTKCNLIKGTLNSNLFKFTLYCIRQRYGVETMRDYIISGINGALAYKIERENCE